MPCRNRFLLALASLALASWCGRAAIAPDLGTNPSTLHAPLASSSHWAFQRPQEHPIPEVRDRGWPLTALDHFILARLEAASLSPSPDADKRTWLRRVTFDLIGLLPTMKEMSDFEADQTPAAYERVVDRLLASPHYGERWGRYWLDVARFADTKGYVYGNREEARFVHSYVYRDWVIRALNDDLPYDRFLMLQLAADQMGEADSRTYQDWIPPVVDSTRSGPTADPGCSPPREGARDDLAALGFLTLGRRFLGVVHDIVDDRIDVTSRGMLGLTVGCARCHDHKFDPIPTADYYSLYGIFNGAFERTVALDTDLDLSSEARAQFEKGLQERVDQLHQTFAEERDQLIQRLRRQAPRYLAAVLDADRLPTEEFYEIRGPEELNPTVVRQWQSYLQRTKESNHPVFVFWHALAALPAEGFAEAAQKVVNELVARQKAEDSFSVNPLVAASLQATPPVSMPDVAERYGRLIAQAEQAWVETRQAATNDPKNVPPTRLPDPALEALRQVLYGPGSPVNLPDGAIVDLEWFFAEKTRVKLAQAQQAIERWIIDSPAAVRYAVILQDRPLQKNAHVFLRGNPANRGSEVPRWFLQVLSGPDRQPFVHGSGRLELAQAIASEDNPLTARVLVNRVWAHHFGVGLVKTPSDFGTRCEPPSHPELLDWLAVRFIKEGWSLKKLHRWILLSRVYRQRSDTLPTPLATRVDAENRWLWRMNPVRLDFEAMRDALLWVSGQLDLSMGGRARRLFQEPFPNCRSVYGYVDRQFVPGVLRMFDVANPDMHSPARPDTTVPQQALFFMNSPFVVERARAVAARLNEPENASTESKVRNLYECLFQRTPSDVERQAALDFLAALESETVSPPLPPKVSAWQYGYGELDENLGRVVAFQPLPHFTGEAWQGGPRWPDAKLGWVQLTAEGGHAGNDLQHAAIRRWTAPGDGVIDIRAVLRHEREPGDGIRAFVVSSRTGLLGQWTLHNESVETRFEALEMRAGDTVDFVVDIRGTLNSDDFHWAPVIERRAEKAEPNRRWAAAEEFAGPPEALPRPLNAWEQYAQVLLLSNEFIFVD